MGRMDKDERINGKYNKKKIKCLIQAKQNKERARL